MNKLSKLSKISTLFALLLLVSTTTFSAIRPPVSGGVPIQVAVTPGSGLEGGDIVLVTVTMSEAPVGNQTITISTSQPGMWQSLPTTATVLNGQTTVQFYAQFTTNAQGVVRVSAAANGHTEHSPAMDVGII